MRFELLIMGVDWNGQETEWVTVKTYKTRKAAEQGMESRKEQAKGYLNRKWKIRDRNDNSVSLYA